MLGRDMKIYVFYLQMKIYCLAENPNDLHQILEYTVCCNKQYGSEKLIDQILKLFYLTGKMI